MRRKDREITDLNRIAEIMQACEAACVAFGGDTPYVIPLSYGFTCEDGRFALYMHGALEGEKIDRIKADPRAAFTMFTNTHVYGEGSGASTSFDSVCGSGTFRFAEGAEKEKGLRVLMAHYMPDRTCTFTQAQLDATSVMVLDVCEITGKHHD